MNSKMTYVRSTVRPVKKAFVIDKTDLKNLRVIMERCSLEIGGIFNLILVADWFNDEKIRKDLKKFVEINDPDLIINLSKIDNEYFKTEFHRKVISTNEKIRFSETPLICFDNSPTIEKPKSGNVRFSDSASPSLKQHIAINYGIANPETLYKEIAHTIFKSKTLMPLSTGFASHLFLVDVFEKFQNSLLKMSILESFSSESSNGFNPENFFKNRRTVVLGSGDDDVESQSYFWSIRATFPWDVIVWLSFSDLDDLCKEKPEFDGEDFELIAENDLIVDVKNKNLFQKANFVDGWKFVWGGYRKAWESFTQTSTVSILDNKIHIEHESNFTFSKQGAHNNLVIDIQNNAFMTLPRGEAVGELCTRLPDPIIFDQYFARISSNGLSVFYDQYEPLNSDSIFLELEIPRSINVFEAYLGQYGYKLKKTSGENVFQRFLELIGGVSKIRSIRNEMAFELFRKMTPLRGKKIAKEIASELQDDGLADRLEEIISKKLNSPIISAPVIKTIDDICSSLGLQNIDRPKLFEILEVLNRQKILLRGKYFECSNCRTFLWYQLDQIEREIKCYACNAITNIPISVGPKELVDSFKLNELVMVSVDQGVIPVLYVLSYLHEILVGGYHYIAGIEVLKAGKNEADAEVDLIINCIGKVGLFEIKAQRGFEKKQFDHLIEVAKSIEADFVVLAALLSKKEQGMIEANEWLKSCGMSYCLLSMEDLLMSEPKKNKELVRLLGLF